MQINRYWARLEGEAVLPSGKKASFFAWGGSRVSQEEADSKARSRIERIAERVRFQRGFPDKYAYGDRPLREEVLREYLDSSGDLVAAITRNSYGAAILNTARIAFVDVDLPRDDSVSAFAARMSRWIRRGPEPDPMANAAFALTRVEDWLSNHPDWGARIYQTRSGLRYLIIHRTFSPEDAELRSAMDAFDADPQYRRLCQVQKSFRARLTPKPWRIGINAPPKPFPRRTPSEAAEVEQWLQRYNEASQSYATCRFVRSVGSANIDSSVAPFIELHDQVSRAESNLPLA